MTRIASRHTAVLITLLALSACTITHDYVFRAEGQVVAENGAALAGVRVTIQIFGPVFRVIDPVTLAHAATDANGHFAFWYISHHPNPPYSLTFEREGFRTETVEGAIQEMNPHKVVLRPIARPSSQSQ